MMRIFKHKKFRQWAMSEGISDEKLWQAIEEMNDGLYDANLGSSLYKKRIAMAGRGKSGSYRTLIAFKEEEKAFFVYGFAKNTQDNIAPEDGRLYKKLARYLLQMQEKEIQILIGEGKLFEVK